MSSVTYGPPRTLLGPTPTPPLYNLLRVATVVADPDLHYLAGGAVYPYPTLADGSQHDPCSTGTTREKLAGGTVPLPEFGAFTVYVAETCSAVGIGDDGAFRARATVALSALEAALVEQEFAFGNAMPGNPYLTDASAAIVDSSGLGPALALALLEDEIAETGKMGVIHTTPGVATALIGAQLAFRDGGLLKTGLGTPIVAGYGYVGMVPLGQAALGAGEGWMIATGPIEIRRTEMEMLPGSLAEALDRLQNDVTYRAERYYLVDWDTELQAAVLVDRAA